METIDNLSWEQLNNLIIEMEREEKRVKDDKILYDEWKKKWNDLIDKSKKLAGCIKRDKR